jgi:hypothetical protein
VEIAQEFRVFDLLHNLAGGRQVQMRTAGSQVALKLFLQSTDGNLLHVSTQGVAFSNVQCGVGFTFRATYNGDENATVVDTLFIQINDARYQIRLKYRPAPI